MKLIGICGLARCGKDSFYDMSKTLLNQKGIKTKRFAFADSLKEECNEILSKYVGISAFTESNQEKQIIRPLLVTYGTHIRRKLNQNCWIDKINEEVKRDLAKNNVVFITDVRFENEIDWIHSLNGASIHITRQGNIAPNEDELKNDPILKNKSTAQLEWKDFKEESELDSMVNEIIKSIL